jgi:paraquat-inducible protein B
MTLPALLNALFTLLLILVVSLGIPPAARAALPEALTPSAEAAANARQGLEDTYRDFKQQWERNNLTIKEQIESSALEARQAFANVSEGTQGDLEQALMTLADWATGARRGAEDVGEDLAAQVQRNLELGQRSVRDLARQFDAFQREVNRSTRTLPKEVRDRFQGDALEVERSIDRAARSLDALVTDAKDSLADASGGMQAKLQDDLKDLNRALEDANRMVSSFFAVA